MFNYEWQKYIKQKYLDLAHAMQIPYHGDEQVILKDIEAANEMIKVCSEYIAEQKEFLGDAEGLTMTNREKTINNISALNDDDFARLFCNMSNCTSCPGKPIGLECQERLMEWLLQEAGND